MRIGMMGMGKLGLPCALASEAAGHEVVGYDPNPAVAGYIRDRKIPYREEGTPELLVHSKIRVVSVNEMVAHSDLIFVAVQTPHNPKFEGVTRIPEERVDFDHSYLIDACKQLNEAIEAQGVDKPVVVISTVLQEPWTPRSFRCLVHTSNSVTTHSSLRWARRYMTSPIQSLCCLE